MNEYDQFTNLFLNALNNVEQEYFNTQFNNFYQYQDAFRNLGRFNGKIFTRYSERGFAYELYHQLRLQVDTFRQENDFFNGYYLQGEIKKMDVQPLTEIYGYRRLGASYIPDILFHTPHQDANAFVIEIKSQPELSFEDLKYDVSKLFKFMTRFNYTKGIFLAVNINYLSVIDLIINNKELFVSIVDNNRLNDCLIIVKEGNFENTIFKKTLEQILNE